MARCHGCRTIENMRNLVGIQEDKLAKETIAFESRIAELAAEAKRTNGPGQIIALPGAQELIRQVSSWHDVKSDRWAHECFQTLLRSVKGANLIPSVDQVGRLSRRVSLLSKADSWI